MIDYISIGDQWISSAIVWLVTCEQDFITMNLFGNSHCLYFSALPNAFKFVLIILHHDYERKSGLGVERGSWSRIFKVTCITALNNFHWVIKQVRVLHVSHKYAIPNEHGAYLNPFEQY